MAVAASFSRVNQTATEGVLKAISEEIMDEYSHLDLDVIIQALKNGGRGKYGRTFKLSVQEVCIWIESYLKDFPEPDINNNKYIYYRLKDEYYLNIRRVLKGVEPLENHLIIDPLPVGLGARKKKW